MTDAPPSPADLRRAGRFFDTIRAEVRTFRACRLPREVRARIDRIDAIASGDRDHEVRLVMGFIDYIQRQGWAITEPDGAPAHAAAVEIAAREYLHPKRREQ